MENFITTEGKLRYLYGIITGNKKMPKHILKGEIGKSVQEGDLCLYSPQLLYKGCIKANLLFIRLLVSEQKYEEATKLAKMFGYKFKINSSYDISTAASYILSNMYDDMFTRKGETLSVELLRSFQIDLATILIDARNAIYDKADNRKLIKYFLKESNENIELFKCAMHDYSGQSLLLDYIQRYLIADLYDTTMVIDTKFKDLDCFSIENYVFGYSLSDIFETFDTMLSDLKCVLPLFPTISDLAEAMDNYRIENDLERFMCNKYTISLCK